MKAYAITVWAIAGVLLLWAGFTSLQREGATSNLNSAQFLALVHSQVDVPIEDDPLVS